MIPEQVIADGDIRWREKLLHMEDQIGSLKR